MAAPTFISATQTIWNETTSPKTTASISIQQGDILVALAATSSWQTGDLQTNNPTVSDSLSLTWTKQQEVAQDQYCGMVIYTATAPSTTSFTVTFTHVHTNTGIFNGGVVIVVRPQALFSGSIVGASTSGFGNLVVPELFLTTTYQKSLVIFFSADWNTNSNSGRQWQCVNNYTPTSGNGYELIYNVAGNYTVYCAYWPDVGRADTYDLGLVDPNQTVLQKSSHTAIEIKGTLEGDSDGGASAGTGFGSNSIFGVVTTNLTTISL